MSSLQADFPSKPVVGLVFRYAYLWRDEHQRQLTEALKKRPAVVVLNYTSARIPGKFVVDVVAVTHTRPPAGDAVPIPPKVKARMGLDSDASWIVTSEVNRFIWPGADIYPAHPATPQKPKVWHWGVLPNDVFAVVRARVIEAIRSPENVVRRPGG